MAKSDDTQITKWSDDEVIEFIRPDMDGAESLQHTLQSQRATHYQRYNQAAYGNEREGFSKSVAPVIHNQHKWTMANLMDIFTEDFFILKGEDDARASKFQKLIYYQMFRKQDGFKKLYDFMWYTNLYHYGVLKIWYKEDFDLVSDNFPNLSMEEMQTVTQNPNVTVTKYDEVVDDQGVRSFQKVKTVERKYSYAGPFFTAVPNSEFFYSADCKIDDWGSIKGRLVYQKVRRTLDDIRKRERAKIYRAGTYDAVFEKMSSSTANLPIDEVEYQFNQPEIPYQSDIEPLDEKESVLNKELEICECYIRLDVDGDGLLEDVIVDLCDNVVCRMVENPQKRPPFRIGHVAPEPNKVIGEAMPDFLDNDQKIQTNLLRLIQDSAALDCYKNPVTNDQNMFNMLQDRKPFAVIKGDPTRLGEIKTSPPTDFILKAMEMQEAGVEKKTGMTRYNQGIDASSLNKTATGIDAIMAASSKPLRLVARCVGTGAILGMIRDFIFLNQLYPPQTDIKLLGTDITVNPDDLTGEHDVEIDVGVSPAEKQAMANQLDLLLQFAMQAGVPMGLMTQLDVAHIIRRKYKFLGTMVDDLMQNDQAIQAAMNAKKNAPPPKPDLKEYIQLDKLYPLLTPMEQAQVLQSFGIQPDQSRQQMPPDALSGGSGPLGATGPNPMQAMQEHMQGLQQSALDHQQGLTHAAQEHAQGLTHANQEHIQGLAQAQQKHTQDIQNTAAQNVLKLAAQTAMDKQQAQKRPYPQGVQR